VIVPWEEFRQECLEMRGFSFISIIGLYFIIIIVLVLIVLTISDSYLKMVVDIDVT